jgi:HlyD family secretion protein
MTATALLTVDKRKDVLLVPNAVLRFTPPSTQPKDHSSSGSLLSSIMPHPPRPESAPRDDANAKSKDQQVWNLRDGQLTAISITKGLTDGEATEVTSGALEPGMEVITDVATPK